MLLRPLEKVTDRLNDKQVTSRVACRQLAADPQGTLAVSYI